MSFSTTTAYVANLADTLTKQTMTEFFRNIHSQFYQDQDISFMEYFLELCEHEDEFYVHHSKLGEYGIMTSTESGNVLKKMSSLGLNKDEDFELVDVYELRIQGGTSTSKHYYLKPEVFKKCLMRAQRRRDQRIDPVIYCDYYLLLEKIYKLYTDYERLYSQKLISIKDDKIDQLIDDNKDLKSKIDNLHHINVEQSREIAELLGYAKDTKNELREVKEELKDINSKFDQFFDFTTEFARMTLPMWIGSSVFKTQLDHLLLCQSKTKALRHLKVMFVVGFKFIDDDRQSKMIIYFCCTNFGEVGTRIKKLYERHIRCSMLKPEAICLISHEINHERAKLTQLKLVSDDAVVEYINRRKAFMITLNGHLSVNDKYDDIVESSRSQDFQGYQLRRNNVSENLNDDIIQHLTNSDNRFFETTLPFCQEFIDCYTRFENGKYEYKNPSRTVRHRVDLGEKCNDTMYPLMKIDAILEKDSGAKEIDEMIKAGIISKTNTKDLFRASRQATISENIDIPRETMDQVEELEAMSDSE